MEASRRAGDVLRLPSEEGQGHLARRWQPRPSSVGRLGVYGLILGRLPLSVFSIGKYAFQKRPSSEALPDPASARLDVHDPQRARQGDVSDHQAG